MEIKEMYSVLSNNTYMPCVGYGTWQLSEQEAYECVLKAIEAGYRHIDTAFAYDNEVGVGKAIAYKNGKVCVEAELTFVIQ